MTFADDICDWTGGCGLDFPHLVQSRCLWWPANFQRMSRWTQRPSRSCLLWDCWASGAGDTAHAHTPLQFHFCRNLHGHNILASPFKITYLNLVSKVEPFLWTSSNIVGFSGSLQDRHDLSLANIPMEFITLPPWPLPCRAPWELKTCVQPAHTPMNTPARLPDDEDMVTHILSLLGPKALASAQFWNSTSVVSLHLQTNPMLRAQRETVVAAGDFLRSSMKDTPDVLSGLPNR